MNTLLERRTYTRLGWPRAGAMSRGSDGLPCIPIDCGNGDLIWIADSAWGRELITALTVVVNQLEALSPPAAKPGPEREPQVESTAVIDAVPAEPPLPEPADVLVHPPVQEATDA